MISKIILILPGYDQSNQLRYLVKDEMGKWRSGSAADMPSLPAGCDRGMSSAMVREYGTEFVLGQAVRGEGGKNIFFLTSSAGQDVTNRLTFLTTLLVTEKDEISLLDLENSLQGAEAETFSINSQISEALSRINHLGSAKDRQNIGEMLRNFARNPQGKWFSSVPFLGVKYVPDNGQGGADTFPLDRKTLLIAGVSILVIGVLALYSCQGRKRAESEKKPASMTDTGSDGQTINEGIAKMEKIARHFGEMSKSDLA